MFSELKTQLVPEDLVAFKCLNYTTFPERSLAGREAL
jgi:hypothetical protein